MSNLSLSGVFFQALNAPKLVSAVGAYDDPPNPLVGWEGTPRFLYRPPTNKIPGSAYITEGRRTYITNI